MLVFPRLRTATIPIFVSLFAAIIFFSGCVEQAPEEKLALAHKAVLEAREMGADSLAPVELSCAQDYLNAAIKSMHHEKTYFAPLRKYDRVNVLFDTAIIFAVAASESTAVRKKYVRAVNNKKSRL